MTDLAQQVLHVGLAKTGTTTLQRVVFPRISQLTGYAYNPHELMEAQSNFLLSHDPKDRKRIEELKAKHAPVFVSDEALARWLPQYFEAAADELLSIWGQHTTILITLRDPVDFQSSLYAGSFRAGAYVRPEDFFVSDEHYSRAPPHEDHWLDDVFNVDKFDLRRLVEIYEERFDRVIALPLNTLFDLQTLGRVFNLSDEHRHSLAQQLATAPKLNSRPAAWDIKAHSLFVKLTGQQMERPRLGARLKAITESADGAKGLARRRFDGRRWWLKLRAIGYRILPDTPYQLPDTVYQNKELNRKNRVYLAELVAKERAARPEPDR